MNIFLGYFSSFIDMMRKKFNVKFLLIRVTKEAKIFEMHLSESFC